MSNRGQRSQSSIEFVLLVGGALLFVALVILIVRNQVISPISNRVQSNASTVNSIINNLTNTTPT